ncbi:alpha/beta fold hydrolase [Niveispirillum fermenti]|uniref:alpha/beta fold hydrolase n=1 Tax=Niveispirillum fermenti TaxID=1233113 RepID=UPI003A899CEA
MTGTQIPVIRGYVDFEQGQMHYLSAGRGVPLLLLHATSDAASMWEPILPRLAALGYHAVALDMPGCGQSDLPAHQPDGPAYGRYLAQAVQGLGFQRFHVLGHHLGASLGAQMVRQMGERVLSFSAYGWPNVDNRAYGEVLRGARPRSFDRAGEVVKGHWVRRWEMSGREMADPSRNCFTEAMAVRTMIALLQCRHWEWLYQAMGHTDHRALAAGVTCPTLLFAGPRDHNYVETKEAVADFPDARFVHMDDVGVDAADEEPDAFCAVLHQFIRDHARR